MLSISYIMPFFDRQVNTYMAPSAAKKAPADLAGACCDSWGTFIVYTIAKCSPICKRIIQKTGEAAGSGGERDLRREVPVYSTRLAPRYLGAQ